MIKNTRQIIQKIVEQRELSKEEILNQIENLRKSLCYDTGVIDEIDPTIAKLLAQELNVDLGDPTDYLYLELLYDEYPICVRIIPFVTVEKEKIKQTLYNLGTGLEEAIRQNSSSLHGINECSPLAKIFMYMKITGAWSLTFVYDGILISINWYTELDIETIRDNSFENIIDRARLHRTFTDYRILRTSDPIKTYLPFSIVDQVFNHPPEWITFRADNRDDYIQFPFITLESLEATPNLEAFVIENTCTVDIIGFEALQYCPNLRQIVIVTRLFNFDFPPWLAFPKLEYIGFSRIYSKTMDLSFLQNCPRLKEIGVSANNLEKIIFPPLNNHLFLEEIRLSSNWAKDIILTSPWNCPNLEKIDFESNEVKTLDLTPLKDCDALKELYLNGNRIEELDLSPLQYCNNLQILALPQT